MRSDCRITIPCARVLSKTDIFQLSVLASRLVTETCHCSENEVGTLVSVGTELQTKAFDSAEEFNKAFPPLAPVGAFCVSALYKPFGGGISVQTARTGLGSVSVFVSAPTDVTAQEIALKIRDALTPMCQAENNSVNQKPRKSIVKPLCSLAKTFASIIGVSADIPQAASLFNIILRFFKGK